MYGDPSTTAWKAQFTWDASRNQQTVYSASGTNTNCVNFTTNASGRFNVTYYNVPRAIATPKDIYARALLTVTLTDTRTGTTSTMTYLSNM